MREKLKFIHLVSYLNINQVTYVIAMGSDHTYTGVKKKPPAKDTGINLPNIIILCIIVNCL